ncbi:MAG: hypothetical protein ACLGIB_06795 [Actinomycetota bacterium]
MVGDSLIQLMQAGSLTMTLFAAILILVVTRNQKDPATRSRVALTMIGLSLLLFAIPLYGDTLGAEGFVVFGQVARIAAAVLLPYGLYSLGSYATPVLKGHEDVDA